MVRVLFIMLIFLIISCKEPLGIEKNVDKSIIEKELFPLSEGNKWQYEETKYSMQGDELSQSIYTLNILSTHIAKGKLWYEINNSLEPSIEHFYSHSDIGLWYRVPNYFPADKFLILNYQNSENDILTYKDFYNTNLSDKCVIETKLINKNLTIEINDVDFTCYHYNLYRIYKDTEERYLFKEQYYAKGIGLIKEIEYDSYEGSRFIRAVRKLTIYKLN